MVTKKTDNADLVSKLRIRRGFLDRYHANTIPRVFESCQGNGLIWRSLGQERDVRVWGVDKKKKQGRVVTDAHRMFASGIGEVDIVDIDTYSEPWSMFIEFLRNHHKSVTVFLTWGMPLIASASNWARGALNIPYDAPSVLASKAVYHLGLRVNLHECLKYTELNVVECRVITKEHGPARVRYIGMRLEDD